MITMSSAEKAQLIQGMKSALKARYGGLEEEDSHVIEIVADMIEAWEAIKAARTEYC